MSPVWVWMLCEASWVTAGDRDCLYVNLGLGLGLRFPEDLYRKWRWGREGRGWKGGEKNWGRLEVEGWGEGGAVGVKPSDRPQHASSKPQIMRSRWGSIGSWLPMKEEGRGGQSKHGKVGFKCLLLIWTVFTPSSVLASFRIPAFRSCTCLLVRWRINNIGWIDLIKKNIHNVCLCVCVRYICVTLCLVHLCAFLVLSDG